MKLPNVLRNILAWSMISYRPRKKAPQINREALNQMRIALVRLDGIGDFIMATTFLQFIGSRLPGADITFFCRRPVGELVRQQYPAWKVVELPPKTTPLKMVYFDAASRRLLKNQQKFDLLIDLRTFRDISDVAASSWIPATLKIAMANAYQAPFLWVKAPRESRAYDELVPLPSPYPEGMVHDLANHRRFAEYLFPNDAAACREALPLLQCDEISKERMIAGKKLIELFDPRKPFLLVCPGARSPIREYPTAKLTEAIVTAVNHSGVFVVIAGTNADLRTTAPLYESLRKQLDHVVDLRGMLNLPEHLALMSMAKAVICMETSHSHMAAALGVPVTIILGGGHYGLFAPWTNGKNTYWVTHRLPCFGCNWVCSLDQPRCVTDIPVQEISRSLSLCLRS